MKKTLIGMMTALVLIFSASAAHADLISVAADLPVVFNASDYTSDKVSGFKISVTLPIFIGLGLEKYKVTGVDLVDGNVLEVNYNMYDLTFGLPIPIVNVTGGLGYGRTTYNLDGASKYKDAYVTQYFVGLGYPFFEVFDVHLEYHAIDGSADPQGAGPKLILDGTMYTLGMKVGF